jgi:hypothetical protein
MSKFVTGKLKSLFNTNMIEVRMRAPETKEHFGFQVNKRMFPYSVIDIFNSIDKATRNSFVTDKFMDNLSNVTNNTHLHKGYLYSCEECKSYKGPPQIENFDSGYRVLNPEMNELGSEVEMEKWITNKGHEYHHFCNIMIISKWFEPTRNQIFWIPPDKLATYLGKISIAAHQVALKDLITNLFWGGSLTGWLSQTKATILDQMGHRVARD